MNAQRPLALITGASSGIGADLARRFAADGYDLILSARRQVALEQLASELKVQHNSAVVVIVADLGEANGAEQLATAVKALNRPLDALVNNAGYGMFGEFKNSSLVEELAMMQVNMHAPVILTKHLLPLLLARRGKIMNIASTAAFQPGPYMSIYYATKSFLLSWSEALAEELRDSGVSVTAICPGPIASGFQDRAAMNDSALVKGKRLPTSAWLATKAYRAFVSRRRVYIPGLVNSLMAQSIRFTPRRIVTLMVRLMSAPQSA